MNKTYSVNFWREYYENELPVPTDISFTIESDNSAEYETMEKADKILENKLIVFTNFDI